MSRIAAFLHSGSSKHDGLLSPDVSWIDVDVGAVVDERGRRPVGTATLLRLGLGLAHGAGAAIRRRLDEFCARGGRVVVCADDGALALAVAYRYLWGGPIASVRLVTADLPAQSGSFGRWLRNRATLVHIAASPQIGLALQAHRIGRHRLLSVSQPDSDDAESAMRLLRDAVDTIGRDPAGDEHLTLAYVTHFYLNLGDTRPAFELFHRYARYDPKVLDRVHFVVVDDGSPLDYEIPQLDLNITWIKIDRDIRWNQSGARNVGMIYAHADNVLLTDIDIVVPEPTLAYLARRKPSGARLYRPSLRDLTTGAPMPRHPNCYLLSRARFFRQFGYDEEFSGHYGFEDLRFVKHQKLHGTFLARLPKKYFVLDRGLGERREAYHSLGRDGSKTAMTNARKQFENDWYGRHAGHSRKSLNFTWTVLADRRRARPRPKSDRLFKPTWYLRQIWPT